MRETAKPTSLLLPASLQKGDVIGLVSPAGPVQNEENFMSGVSLLKEMGFQVKFPRTPLVSDVGYLAGQDWERAEEFHELWADSETKALLCVRGGYGSLRIIDSLDMKLIRQRPKILIGFSDISILLNTIFKETGLVTFHGPVLTTLAHCGQQSVQLFYETLTGRAPKRVKPARLEVLAGGRARGRLLGGNLTTLVHLIGTPYEMTWDDTILFLEDTGEIPYRIDRMLTHLKLADRFDRLKGLILGTFTSDTAGNCPEYYTDPIWTRVLELMEEKNIPIWANFPVGHGPDNYILPMGIDVEMDSDKGTLHFLEPCTV
jgi:muramoyltetrapeptide carboxypeptidase